MTALPVGTEDSIDERLLTELLQRLAGLRYETVGFVEALVLSPQRDEHRLVRSLSVIPEAGVEGQYPGKQWWQGKRQPGRQISAVNAEVLDALDLSYEISGDNLVIRGYHLAYTEPGDVLRIGDVFLTATHTPHRPCATFARRTSLTKMKAISAARYRGTLFDALRPGTLRVGDSVERIVLTAELPPITVDQERALFVPSP